MDINNIDDNNIISIEKYIYKINNNNYIFDRFEYFYDNKCKIFNKENIRRFINKSIQEIERKSNSLPIIIDNSANKNKFKINSKLPISIDNNDQSIFINIKNNNFSIIINNKNIELSNLDKNSFIVYYNNFNVIFIYNKDEFIDNYTYKSVTPIEKYIIIQDNIYNYNYQDSIFSNIHISKSSSHIYYTDLIINKYKQFKEVNFLNQIPDNEIILFDKFIKDNDYYIDKELEFDLFNYNNCNNNYYEYICKEVKDSYLIFIRYIYKK